MSCGCAGTKKKPAGQSLAPFGEIGLLKLVQVSNEPYDVYGEVTDQAYPFLLGLNSMWIPGMPCTSSERTSS